MKLPRIQQARWFISIFANTAGSVAAAPTAASKERNNTLLKAFRKNVSSGGFDAWPW